MMKAMHKGNSKICFILLPGLAPDTVPVIGIKAALEEQGFSVVADNFFGDIEVNDFSKLTAEDCINNISKTIDRISEKYEMFFGIGISLGGALLLEYSKKGGNLNGIVSIGTPFRLSHRGFIRIVQKIYPFIYPVWKRLQKYKKLRLLPIGAGNMVIDYLENKFLNNLDQINTPLLFLHSKKDNVTDYRALSEFVPLLSSKEKEITFFDNGNHVIDCNPELIMKYALDFFGFKSDPVTEKVQKHFGLYQSSEELIPEVILPRRDER